MKGKFSMEFTKFNNGINYPKIIFGTFRYNDTQTFDAVIDALRCGHRAIDTAQAYNNEKGIGEAINTAIQEGIIKREEIFITTKLNPHRCIGYQNTLEYIEESLSKLSVDYIDLFLIHWPRVTPDNTWKLLNAETWRAIEDCVLKGKIKSAGVSNFMIHHLEELLKTAKIKPVVNQIQFSPQWQQRELVDFCKKHDIKIQGYYTLGETHLLKNKTIVSIAQKYNKDSAQIIFRYCIQKGVIPIQKSSKINRIQSNMAVFDFNLNEEDVKILDELNSHPHDARYGLPDCKYELWNLLEELTLSPKSIISEKKIKLFNYLTIAKIKYLDENNSILYLFKIIPLLKISHEKNTTKVFLCSCPIFTIKKKYKNIAPHKKLIPRYDKEV